MNSDKTADTSAAAAPDGTTTANDPIAPNVTTVTDNNYWTQLKPFQEGVPLLVPEERRKQYLLSLTGSRKFNVENTVKRFEHLLLLSGLFKHFIIHKAERDEKFKAVLDILRENKAQNEAVIGRKHQDARRRKSEREEDAELLIDEEQEGESGGSEGASRIEFQFRDSPAYINGKLRDYQIQGLNWLISLHSNGLAGILADEMGLGKTLQTVSFLGYLRYLEKIPGPFLVIAPKSTLNNWLREINRWTPEVEAFILQGDKEERANLIETRLLYCNFDVVIASYEIIIREKASFRKFDWQYIIIDEAHRIKNEESLLSQVLREFTSRNRLLLTGTPLQNNLHELWALLNFLLPDIFSDSQDFDNWFSTSATTEEDKESVVKQLHAVLQPFLLRRVKSDVEKSLLPKKELNIYVGMSSMQKMWYRKILEKDLDAVNVVNGVKESKTRLLNIVMQLRKCCNHPYLFDGAEPGPPYTTDEHLVYNSGKLKVLDQLLKNLKANGSRVLIFSQMSRLLDILEDYCFFRGYEYCRIDGSTDHEERIKAIDEYNAPDSTKFIFLLTTRAGGLGINLTSADVVILYDSDWNPQADLQAMDRAHRIGQKKQVKVFRLVTDNSVEEKILERATQKLRLDQLVIQANKSSIMKKRKENPNEAKVALLSMIQHGAADVFKEASSKTNSTTLQPTEGKNDINNNNNTSGSSSTVGTADNKDVDLDALLSLSEKKTQSLRAKFESLGLDDLQKFTTDSAYEWNGEDFKRKVQKGIISQQWISPAKRERKENYSVDNYYKGVLSSGKPSGPAHNRIPKIHSYSSHQFLPPHLRMLYEKERLWAAKKADYEPVLDDLKLVYGDSYDDKEDDSMKQRRLKFLKLMIKNAQPLTEEEEKLKEEWEGAEFANWNKVEFRRFVTLTGKYGRHSIENIALDFSETKTLEEVRAYATAFWSRIEEIDDYERYLKNIETDEEKLEKVRLQQEALRRVLSKYNDPMFDLKLKHPVSRTYTEEEDRFILLMLFKYGPEREDVYELIRNEIRESPLFEVDYSFRMKTSSELARRGATLLQAVEKEFGESLLVDNDFRARIDEEDATWKRTRDELLDGLDGSGRPAKARKVES